MTTINFSEINFSDLSKQELNVFMNGIIREQAKRKNETQRLEFMNREYKIAAKRLSTAIQDCYASPNTNIVINVNNGEYVGYINDYDVYNDNNNIVVNLQVNS